MNFKKVIAALDFSTIDDGVISYVRYLKDLVDMEKVYFMHIMKDLAKPENVALQFHQLFRPDVPVDEKLENEMRTKVQEIMPSTPDLEQSFEVHEGSPVDKMLHWAEIKNIDLVVFGRKSKSEGSGLTPRRMAHKLNSNLLFVTESHRMPIRRVVVPIDYSEHSFKAIEAALQLRKKIPGLSVVALHVIEMMPVHHYPANTAYQQYIGLMKEANRKAYNKMISEKNINENDLEKVFIENSQYTIPRAIKEYLKENPCDLVILGAQGHSRLRNFFFGSTTERFIDSYDASPTLIIR